jgi:hypothetical protein
MLTRENFKNTWGRPKMDSKSASVPKDEEKMVVDTTATTENVAEMAMEGVVKTPLEQDTKKDDNKNNESYGNTRIRIPRKMPIFGFQHRGIGAVKSKRQDQKPKQKK